MNGKWQIYDVNYENAGNSMISLFILSTLEGWPDYLMEAIDSNHDGPIF